ncbi:MAG: transposase [Pseudomonadota bacterium]
MPQRRDRRCDLLQLAETDWRDGSVAVAGDERLASTLLAADCFAIACRAVVGIKPIRIYPGSPWENGYNGRFNGTLRREVLTAAWFTTTEQAQIVIDHWLRQYNHTRPHQALNMRPPVPETLLEKPPMSGQGIRR